MTNVEKIDLAMAVKYQAAAYRVRLRIDSGEIENNARNNLAMNDYRRLAYQHLCYAKGWNHMEGM